MKIFPKIKDYFLSRSKNYLIIGVNAAIIVLIIGGVLINHYYFKNKKVEQDVLSAASQAVTSKDIYIKFLFEIYDKIKENYWDNIADAQLTKLYQAGSEKLVGTQFNLKSSDKAGVEEMLDGILKGFDEAQKKEFTVKLASIVVANLQPFGRSGLYTTRDEQNLKNEVLNANPNKDLYAQLDASKDSSAETLKQNFENKSAQLEKEAATSTEAAKELEKVKYAYDVLTDTSKKERYDSMGAEPTIFTKLITPEIVHLYIKRFSPTTLDEFVAAVNKVDKGDKLQVMILDLRGNIGGSIDLLPYLLGPFIGNDRYAYDFFRKGESIPFKTKTGWLQGLVRYKEMVILADGQSQSTAELLVATLKKYNVGIFVGKKTKGWGTIERVFPLETQIDSSEKYSMFLVHTLTLSDDNQPIEGRGVEPTISIDSADWKKQLFAYFRNNDLVRAVEDLWAQSPAEFSN